MQTDFQNQTNRVMAKVAERAATKGIMIGVDIFKAILGFLRQMLMSFLGK